MKESQLVTFCFLWWQQGSEGRRGQLVGEGQEKALDAFFPFYLALSYKQPAFMSRSLLLGS